MSDPTEGEGRVVAAGSPDRLERMTQRRRRGNHPVVVVVGVHEPDAAAEIGGQLPEHPVGAELPQVCGVGAGLAVPVLEVLIAPVDPGSVTPERPAGVDGSVAVPTAGEAPTVAVLPAGGVHPDRLGGQRIEHPEIRGVATKHVRALPGHDVEHGAGAVAVLGRCAERHDLDLLDHVGIRPRPRRPGNRRGEVHTVHEVAVLVHPRAEGGHPAAGAAGRIGRRHARRHLREVEEAEPPKRRVLQVIARVVRRDARPPGVDGRGITGHRDCLGDRGQTDRDAASDRAADPYRNAFFHVGRKTGKRHRQGVLTGRKAGEAVLPDRIRHDRARAAWELVRRERRRGARQDASLRIVDRAHDRAGNLRVGAGRDEKQNARQNAMAPGSGVNIHVKSSDGGGAAPLRPQTLRTAPARGRVDVQHRQGSKHNKGIGLRNPLDPIGLVQRTVAPQTVFPQPERVAQPDGRSDQRLHPHRAAVRPVHRRQPTNSEQVRRTRRHAP